jgi:hypothetical protein
MIPGNFILPLAALAASGLIGVARLSANPVPLVPGAWQLQFQDDFNGNSLDGTKWRLGQH